MDEKKKQYNIKYIRDFVRQFNVKFNKQYDQEIIEWLESKENISQYIRTLVVDDMEKHNRT